MEIWVKGTTRYGVKRGLANYPGEPARNFETREEREFKPATNQELNEWALKAKEEIREAVRIRKWVEKNRNTLTEEEIKDYLSQAKEIYDSSIHYYKIMQQFFGHRGWEQGNLNKPLQNLVSKMTDSVFGNVTEAGTLTERIWKAIDNCIMDYEEGKGDFRGLMFINFRLTKAKYLKEKGKDKDNKQQNNKDDGNKKKRTFIEVSLYQTNENGEETIIELEDEKQDFYRDLGGVENAKKLIGLFMKMTAGNKEKRQFVLDYMFNNYVVSDEGVEVETSKKSRRDKSQKFNVANCAKKMAERFGGSWKTHERFINRFRNKLEAVVMDIYRKYNDEVDDRVANGESLTEALCNIAEKYGEILKPNISYKVEEVDDREEATKSKFFNAEVKAKNQERKKRYSKFIRNSQIKVYYLTPTQDD